MTDLPPSWRWCWICPRPQCRTFFLIRRPGPRAAQETCRDCGLTFWRDKGRMVLATFPGADEPEAA
jgi:hypothetical protein